MIFLYIILLLLYLLLARKYSKKFYIIIPIFIILFILFFNILFYYSPSFNQKIMVIDSSKSMEKIFHGKRNAYTLNFQNELIHFKGFNKKKSPIYQEILTLNNFSLLTGIRIDYISDFNFTDNLDGKNISNFVDFIPIKKSEKNKNIAIISLFPKEVYANEKADFYLTISSNYKNKGLLKVFLNNKLVKQKLITLKRGENHITFDLFFKKSAVYPMRIQYENKKDKIEFDNNYFTDIIVNNKYPNILLTYRYPSKDIGIITHILKKDGFMVFPKHISKVKNFNKYDGIVFYNFKKVLNQTKPTLFIGDCQNLHTSALNEIGLTISNHIYSKIKINSVLKKGSILLYTDKKKAILGYDNEQFFITITNFYTYCIMGDNFIYNQIYQLINLFEEQVGKKNYLNFDSPYIIKGEKKRIFVSSKIKSVQLNNKSIPFETYAFNFLPKEMNNIKIQTFAGTIERSYNGFKNQIEDKFIGFNEKKFQQFKSHFIKSKVKLNQIFKEKKRIFEHPIFLILALILLILYWL